VTGFVLFSLYLKPVSSQQLSRKRQGCGTNRT